MGDVRTLHHLKVILNSVPTNCVSVFNLLLCIRFSDLPPGDSPSAADITLERGLVTQAWGSRYKGRAGLEQVLSGQLLGKGKASPVLTTYQQVTSLLLLLRDTSESCGVLPTEDCCKIGIGEFHRGCPECAHKQVILLLLGMLNQGLSQHSNTLCTK